jgi:CRISPR-associated protein Csx10
MIALTFELKLQEPVLAAALEGDPNSAVTLPYIPGSLVRGALIGRYLKQHSNHDLAADPNARRLFFDHETRFLNAYPQGENGARTLPTPRSWKVQKGCKKPIYDLNITPQLDPDLPSGEMWQPKSLRHAFCRLDDDQVILYHPQTQVTIHTQRDQVMGRATEGSGAVFRYEALAPEQTFVGVILCPDDEVAQTLTDLLAEGVLFLGGSRHAGYGLVTQSDIEPSEEWQEALSEVADVSPGGRLTFTLLSDALLRDAQGQYVGALTSACLHKYLDAELTLDAEHTYTSEGIVGGFNRKWGLPLPQVPVAQAGSVYTFTAEEKISAEKLARLLVDGIGERRVEGFGRLACNWHSDYTELTRLDPHQEEYVEELTLSGSSAKIARRMANCMLRRCLDRQLRERVNSIAVQGVITNTQLSQISVLMRSALAESDTETLKKRLKEMKKTAGDQFQEAQVGQQSLLDWLQTVLDESPADLWQQLFKTGFQEQNLPAVGDVAASWSGGLPREYALRLIDGVISRELDRRRSRHA